MYISNSHFFCKFPWPARLHFPFSRHNKFDFLVSHLQKVCNLASRLDPNETHFKQEVDHCTSQMETCLIFSILLIHVNFWANKQYVNMQRILAVNKDFMANLVSKFRQKRHKCYDVIIRHYRKEHPCKHVIII